MCGLAGFLDPCGDGDAALWTRRLEAMAARIAHRGPDSRGTWLDRAAGIGLAHARLAVIDLSPAGAQPMHSADGTLTLAFNGEIYNHADLRAELDAIGAAPTWRGRSDTETLLAGFAVWGVEATLRRAVGMFAFALWDGARRSLTLGRDRLGEKPLYYGWTGAPGRSLFLFGSEIRALRGHPGFDPEIDRGGLALLLRDGYVHGEGTIHRAVRRLPPGTTLTVTPTAPDPPPLPYWSAVEAISAARGRMFDPGDPAAAMDALEAALDRAVAGQMLSDAPLGAFLSGGVDSSLVVALMRRHASGPLRTFAIGFDDPAFDEAAHAGAVAAHLGTEHSTLTVTGADALAVVPGLPDIFDEPLADASQIPTYIVARMARTQVTVALSGDGGDELFGGYRRYDVAARFWNRIARSPAPLRRAAGSALGAIPRAAWDLPARLAGRSPAHAGPGLGQSAGRAAALLRCPDLPAFYDKFSAFWPEADSVVIGAPSRAEPAFRAGLGTVADLAPAETMMARDTLRYLPDDVLAKVDRAAMRVSLETRAPLLDHRVFELAWRIPFAFKHRDGRSKWILRQVLHRHVPTALVDRPKMGFSPPVGAWLRGPLRDWADALLRPERLAQEGWLRPAPIHRIWSEHLSGACDWHQRLWHVLMFQAWLEAGGGRRD